MEYDFTVLLIADQYCKTTHQVINIVKYCKTTHQVIGEELKYMEEAEDHPVSEPSEFER